MKNKLIILTCIIPMLQAQAYDYGEIINQNQAKINHNKYYAEAEKNHAYRLDKEKGLLAQATENYRQAHIQVMRADARVRELENQSPDHQAYASNWADGQVQRRIR